MDMYEIDICREGTINNILKCLPRIRASAGHLHVVFRSNLMKHVFFIL